MKLYAPNYYSRFACIADRCRHSCCVGWEIDIDEDTLEKYSSLNGEGYSKEIKESIEYEQTPHFRLTEGDRCPHLDERGLCKIIKSLGEGYLCNICDAHPRFFNETPRGLEAGLGLSCEEAARIILSSDDYKTIEAVGEAKGNEISADFDPKPFRDRLFAILSDRSLPYTERLSKIYETFNVSPARLTDGEWREALSALEYLDESHRALFFDYSSRLDTPKMTETEMKLERALAYFIYRHTGGATDDAEAGAALGFSLFCERLLASMIRERPDIELEELARILSEELEYSEDNTAALTFEFYM